MIILPGAASLASGFDCLDHRHPRYPEKPADRQTQVRHGTRGVWPDRREPGDTVDPDFPRLDFPETIDFVWSRAEAINNLFHFVHENLF